MSVPIIVNGREAKWSGESISFEDVVRLGFPDAQFDAATVFTVTWKKGHDGGSMVAGQSVHLKPGTIFNVTRTSRA